MSVSVISPNQQQGHTVRKMQHEIVNRTVRHIKENHLHSLCVPICLTNPHYGIYTMSITQTNSIIPHPVSCKNWEFWLHLCVYWCNNICSNPYKQHFLCNYYRCQSDNIYRPSFVSCNWAPRFGWKVRLLMHVLSQLAGASFVPYRTSTIISTKHSVFTRFVTVQVQTIFPAMSHLERSRISSLAEWSES